MLNSTSYIPVKRDGEAGGSLVETIIVFMIIAIVMAFALPVVGNTIRAYNLRSAAQHIAERLAGGRALAMSKNRNIVISFNTGVGGSVIRYGYDFTPVGAPDGVPDSSDPDDVTQSYYVESPPSGITVMVAAGGTSLTSGKGVTYTSRGELPIGASQVDITLTSGSKTSTVSVNLRGQVWIH
jgi:type II secretory pathway pseudopilin PulG